MRSSRAELAIADIMAASKEGKLEEGLRHRHRRRGLPGQGAEVEGRGGLHLRRQDRPLTQKLYDTLTGIQWGKIPDTKGWTVKVD